jgi:hypothetical protein
VDDASALPATAATAITPTSATSASALFMFSPSPFVTLSLRAQLRGGFARHGLHAGGHPVTYW